MRHSIRKRRMTERMGESLRIKEPIKDYETARSREYGKVRMHHARTNYAKPFEYSAICRAVK